MHDCQKECEKNVPSCKAVDYLPSTKQCILKLVNSSTVALKDSTIVDYAEILTGKNIVSLFWEL